MQRQERPISPYYDNLRDILHDLAQPLSTVTGLIDLMLLELDERDKMFQEVQLISQQLEKVMQIVGEIRRMALEAANHTESPWDRPRPRCLDGRSLPQPTFSGVLIPDCRQRVARLSGLCRSRLNHHARLGPPSIVNFLVGAVCEPPHKYTFRSAAPYPAVIPLRLTPRFPAQSAFGPCQSRQNPLS